MKHFKLIFPALTILALLLAACSSAGGQTGTPAATGGVGEGSTGVAPTNIPNTGGTEVPTMPVPSAFPTMAPTGAASSPVGVTQLAPTMAATQSAPTSAVTAATNTLVPTMAATSSSGGVSATGTAPATGIIGVPATGNGQLAGLGAMLKWRVVDTTGNVIGNVHDFVVNMCEAHIVYIAVDPATGNAQSSGQQMLIPYEAFLTTPNRGRVDAAQGVFVLNASAASLSNAPMVNVNSLDLQNPNWDSSILTYWRQNFRLALTTGCNVPVRGAAGTSQPGVSGTAQPAGTSMPAATSQSSAASTPVFSGTQQTGAFVPTYSATKTSNREVIYKIGLATRLLSAPLQDFNANPLGTARDFAIIPATGGVMYIVVEQTGGNQFAATPNAGSQGTGKLVALPPGAVNIQYPNASDPTQPVLILLARTDVYMSAPVFNGNTGMNDPKWFNYWNQYIPMTQSELP